MDKKEYPAGDPELLKLIRHSCDAEEIREQVRKIENINEPILNEEGYSTTYLYEAVSASNLPAVQVLLESGADPNYYNDDLIYDCPLWELQYCDEFDPEIRYQIAEEFFQHGADPNFILDEEADSLYEYVRYKLYNDSPPSPEFDYLLKFYNLLIAYGGGELE